MRKYLIYVAMALGAATIALAPGCALMAPSGVPVSQTLPAVAQEAQRAINEANVLLTASARVVAQNRADGIYNDAEVEVLKARLQALAKDVDKAQDLLRIGDFTSARTQSELLSRAIIALHKEVVAKARKP